MNVSVIVATFGDPAWAARAARASISAQGQHAAEIVVLHREDATLAEVRNQAAAAASGDYLVFLDADDELTPGYLDAMRQEWLEGAITTDWAPLLVPAVAYVHGNGYEEPPRIPQHGLWPKLNECVIGTGVSAALFEQVGGFREFPSLEDYDLWIRCFDAGARLVYVPDAIYRASVSGPLGRNADQTSYPEIWNDHLERSASRA